MIKNLLSVVVASVLATVSCSCAAGGALPAANEFGTDPRLVAPESSFLPTVKPAEAIGWPEGKTPLAAEGLSVTAFASGLDHPRWLTVLPNGDVLVAESRAPADTGGMSGIKAWVAEKMMAYAGAGGASANRITLLRDNDKDGVAETQSVLVSNLNSPIGMAYVEPYLYVANTDALVRFPYQLGQMAINAQPELLVNLPGGEGELNHHWTKSLIANPAGTKLYVGVGSNSNIAENGMDAEQNRAAILEVDLALGETRVFADGLRNPVGLAWQPKTEQLWVAVNERDELGDQLVPDYITSVQEGGFYGWPYSYYGDHVDVRVQPQNPEKVAAAIKPDYAVGAHTASLGLAFYPQATEGDMANRFAGGAFVGQHGSWNRNPRSGYKVIFVRFEDGAPVGMPEDIVSGFLSEDGEAYGRPAGVTIGPLGDLLVADDVGDTIWRVTSSTQ